MHPQWLSAQQNTLISCWNYPLWIISKEISKGKPAYPSLVIEGGASCRIMTLRVVVPECPLPPSGVVSLHGEASSAARPRPCVSPALGFLLFPLSPLEQGTACFSGPVLFESSRIDSSWHHNVVFCSFTFLSIKNYTHCYFLNKESIRKQK